MLNRILFVLLLLLSPVLAAKPVLTVWTYHAFAADQEARSAIKQAFEQTCDCTLNIVTLENSVALLKRLRMQGKNAKADVILGLDNNLLAEAHRTGLFAESGIDTAALRIPGGWQDKTFIPFDYGWFAFIYNKNKLPSPPTSLKALIEHHDDLKIIYPDPRTSTPGLGLLLWMKKVYGDRAPAAWETLAAKTVTVTKGWSDAWTLFLKGEADMVLSYTSSPAYNLIIEQQRQYAAAIFSEGHYLQVEVAGRLANSQQPALAKRFLQFMLTPAFQQVIPTGNWLYPVIPVPLANAFKTLSVPDKTLRFTPSQVADKRREWISEWQRAVSR